MNVTSTVRDTAELNPLVEIMLQEALKRIRKEGINPLVVETYRPKERQYYLYGQGRSEKTCIGAGMPKNMAKKYAKSGNQVTWTLSSIHIKRCAVDLIPQRNGKAIWNSKDKETLQIITIMKNVGFEAGANWKNSPDSPHFQVDGISTSGKNFTKSNTNKYITKMIQRQLKGAGYYKGYEVDGKWGTATDTAIKKWRKAQKWSSKAVIGTKALKKLLTY